MSQRWLWRKNWLMTKVILAHTMLLLGLRLAMNRWIWKLIMRPALFAFVDAEQAQDLTDEWLAQLCNLQRHIERFRHDEDDNATNK